MRKSIIEIVSVFFILVFSGWTVYCASGHWSHVSDEPAHIASGLELLERGTYLYEAQHPPLARVSAAFPLYLEGIHGGYSDDFWIEGLHILSDTTPPDYEKRLRLARLGVLPWFILNALIVYLWAREVGGIGAGFFAILLFVCLPPVLTHAGVATTDSTFSCWFLAATYALFRWFKTQNLFNTLVLGVACGFALGSKMTALPFGLCAVLAGLILFLGREFLITKKVLASVVLTGVVAVSVLWAIYGFDISPLIISKRADELLVHIPTEGWGVLARKFLATPIPLARYLTGIVSVWRHNHVGHAAVFFGEVSTNGWWYFFPVVFLIKTPVPFLLSISLAVFLILFSKTKIQNQLGLENRRDLLFPLITSAIIFASVIPTSINIGVRHILPIYGLLTVSVAAIIMSQRFRNSYGRYLIAAPFLAWQLIETGLAFPNYFPYFNQIPKMFGREPYTISCNSDYDWGQDGLLLGKYMRALGSPAFSNATVLLTLPDDEVILPKHESVRDLQNIHGYLAISRCGTGPDGVPLKNLNLISDLSPIAEIGKTILLYQVP